MPDRVVGSAEQWNMEMYASLPAVNWNFNEQGCLILDNGDVWVYTPRTFDNLQGGESNELFLAKITPEGAVRYTPDYWASTDDNTTNPTTGADSAPYDLVSNIYDHSIFFRTNSSWMITDGKKIWFRQATREQFFEFDPETLIVTRVAGIYDASEPLDSHDGLSAGVPGVDTAPVVHEGYCYWAEGRNVNGTFLASIRRMKLSAPYSVETWAMDYDPPGIVDNTWSGTTNTSTGLPNFLNNDVLLGFTCKIGFHGDYVYYISGSGPAFQGKPAGWAIKRAPIDDPSNAESLHYGLRNVSVVFESPPLHYDDQDVYKEFPDPDVHWRTTGTPSWDPREPYKGVREHEGLGIVQEYPGTMLSDGRWVIPNYSGGEFQPGYQQFGGLIIAIDLPGIEERWESEGVFLHDGFDPMWKTICNASSMDETVTNFNFNVRDRGWNFRCGTKPLIPHPYAPTIGYNPNSPFKEKLMFMTGVISYITTNISWQAPQTAFIVTLEESNSGSASFDVELIFEGQSLKGYSNVIELESAFSQGQVVLK